MKYSLHTTLHYAISGDFNSLESTNKAPVCVLDHSNESYRAVLSCGTVCYAIPGDSNF